VVIAELGVSGLAPGLKEVFVIIGVRLALLIILQCSPLPPVSQLRLSSRRRLLSSRRLHVISAVVNFTVALTYSFTYFHEKTRTLRRATT